MARRTVTDIDNTWTFLARPTEGGPTYFRHNDSREVGIADPGDAANTPVFLDVSERRHVEVFLRDDTGTVAVRIPVRSENLRVAADSIAELAWLLHEGHIDVRHIDIGESLRDVVTVAQAVMAVQRIGDVQMYREPVKKPNYLGGEYPP